MKRIMVDMDDVMVLGNFTRLLESYLGREIDKTEIKGYYIQDILGDEKEAFFEYFKTQNLYEKATLTKDCYEVLEKLSKRYEIYICTDYIWREIVEAAGDNLRNKYNFLYQQLPFISPRNYIFTGNKSIVDCEIKIDDKVENLTGNCQKLLFTAYHNKELSEEDLKQKQMTRVNNWKEVEKFLLKEGYFLS